MPSRTVAAAPAYGRALDFAGESNHRDNERPGAVPSNYVAIHPEQSSRLGSYLGVAVREDTAYTTHKGVEKDGVRRRAQKAIEKLRDALRKALQPEEAVLYLAAGQVAATPLEQAFLGWHSYSTGGGVLVRARPRAAYASRG